MTLIKRIINWLISFFKKLFGINNQRLKKPNKENIKLEKKSSKLGNTNSFFDETIPNYMIISDNDKEKLLYSLSLMKKLLCENNITIKEKEELELFDFIKKSKNIDSEILNRYEGELDKLFKNDFIKSIVKKSDEDTKKEIINRYQLIEKREEEFKTNISNIEKICKLINNKKISIVVEDEIESEVNNITNDKNIINNMNAKVDNFCKNIYEIIDRTDTGILEETKREYNKINYVTLSTIIIDKNYEKFKKLQEDFKNHRFNIIYYEREINKIKHELNKIKNIKNKKEVNDHILNLRKELYTKSKDKYDLLYNNEVFMDLEKECDNLLNRINAKVIDIKKEKEETKVEEKKKKRNVYLENILLRFEDMDLARELILKDQEEEIDIKSINDLKRYINNLYLKFINNPVDGFHFKKNQQKTEFVILYNGLNRVIGELKHEPYILIDHINFRMDDLVEAVKVRKNELESIVEEKNIIIENPSVDEKIDVLSPKKTKKSRVLIKEINHNRNKS